MKWSRVIIIFLCLYLVIAGVWQSAKKGRMEIRARHLYQQNRVLLEAHAQVIEAQLQGDGLESTIEIFENSYREVREIDLVMIDKLESTYIWLPEHERLAFRRKREEIKEDMKKSD